MAPNTCSPPSPRIVPWADLTRILQGLVGREFLEQVGQKRGTSYRLPGRTADVLGKPPEEGVILHKQLDIPHKDEGFPHKPEEPLPGAEVDPVLLEIAKPAQEKKRLPPLDTQRIILELCEGRHLTVKQIASLLRRHPDGVRDRFLTQMVENGQLHMLFPGEPKRPGQAYTSHITGKKYE